MKPFSSVVMLVLLATSLPVWGQSSDREQLLAQIRALRSELKIHEEQFLAPAPSDFEAFAEFLRQPDTGLVRLLPRDIFDNAELLTIRGGGAYYSFTRLTHEYGYGSDISLERGTFSVGFAGADYGFLVVLGGAMSVRDVTLDHPAVGYLATLQAVTTEPEARVEQRRAGEGFFVGDIQYKNRMPAIAGRTYALRSINYGGSDVLVGFQVVRQDIDGSMILVWKLLKRFDVPTLQR